MPSRWRHSGYLSWYRLMRVLADFTFSRASRALCCQLPFSMSFAIAVSIAVSSVDGPASVMPTDRRPLPACLPRRRTGTPILQYRSCCICTGLPTFSSSPNASTFGCTPARRCTTSPRASNAARARFACCSAFSSPSSALVSSVLTRWAPCSIAVAIAFSSSSWAGSVGGSKPSMPCCSRYSVRPFAVTFGISGRPTATAAADSCFSVRANAGMTVSVRYGS
ncbi:hypothetical protein D9M69_435470 [compost metagenome]